MFFYYYFLFGIGDNYEGRNFASSLKTLDFMLFDAMAHMFSIVYLPNQL